MGLTKSILQLMEWKDYEGKDGNGNDIDYAYRGFLDFVVKTRFDRQRVALVHETKAVIAKLKSDASQILRSASQPESHDKIDIYVYYGESPNFFIDKKSKLEWNRIFLSG